MDSEVCNAQITKQDLGGKNIYSIGDVMQELGRMSCQLNEINHNNKVFADSILKIENSVGQVKLDNKAVKKEVRVLAERNEEIDQYMRLNNVLIDGIPKLEKENVRDIVLNIGEKIGVNITESDIDIAHRLPQWKSGKPPTIIVKFVRRTIKSKKLYDGKFAFVWVKNGHIYIREEEGKPAVLARISPILFKNPYINDPFLCTPPFNSVGAKCHLSAHISDSPQAVELNTTSALANYATEADAETEGRHAGERSRIAEEHQKPRTQLLGCTGKSS
uniref:Uncharacterized protein n=1 Tax=Timema douglasi TaxID=61478 RepID=A0A7R8VFC7_TIMDO|nr:unnamed protein product [Timema douglasi]